jgi:hypothetical protein
MLFKPMSSIDFNSVVGTINCDWVVVFPMEVSIFFITGILYLF